MTRHTVLFLWLGLVLSQAASQSLGYEAYKRADKLFVAKKFPEALAAVEDALRLDANLVPALTLHAKMAMAMNRFDVSRQSLEHAIAVDPKSSYAQFLYGLNFYLTNDLRDALPQFEIARKVDPADARSALYLGLTLESLGRNEEALTMYGEAVRLAPQADTYLTGARLLLLLGRLEQCELWTRNALKLQPKSRDAHFELARLLARQEKYTEAAGQGEQALKLSGGSVPDSKIHYLLIRAYRDSDPAKSAAHAQAWRGLEQR